MVQVLVIEDDATLVHAITRNLAARGYSVRSAETVAEALAVLEQDPPRLMLLDIDLPDGSGWEVARRARDTGGKTVVVTMSALRPNARLCAECHVVGLLEKPFPMESLLRLVADYAGPAVALNVERPA